MFLLHERVHGYKLAEVAEVRKYDHEDRAEKIL